VTVRVGQIWVERGKETYRPGETPKKPRLWLVVKVPTGASFSAPHGAWQATLVNLETGGRRRVNLGVLARSSARRGWEMWHDSPSPGGATEPREK
jgi:hypothetical protein